MTDRLDKALSELDPNMLHEAYESVLAKLVLSNQRGEDMVDGLAEIAPGLDTLHAILVEFALSSTQDPNNPSGHNSVSLGHVMAGANMAVFILREYAAGETTAYILNGGVTGTE